MIPFIVYHPQLGHGERRDQLVQNVDIYATVLAAFGRELPEDRHGVNLLPVLADPAAPTRDYAIAGQFARSATITDGRWTLHQGPDPEQPLYWHGYHQQRFLGGPHTLGPYAGGRRRVVHDPVPADYLGTWLSDLETDPSERHNVAGRHPARVAAMQEALGDTFDRLGAPSELRARFRL
jgi:arylsulfatase A-like enzyme